MLKKAKNPDMVYEMIFFHTNSNLCGSWIDKDEILDKYPIKVRWIRSKLIYEYEFIDGMF